MKLEDYTIHFKYGGWNTHGEMTINLHPFLLGEGRGINRVKKLLKIISTVPNIQPEPAEILKHVQSFIEQFNDEYQDLHKKNTNMVISLEYKVKLAERMLAADRQNRDRVKHFSGKGKINPAWEKLNEVVNVRKDELKDLKHDLSAAKSAVARMEKDKEFLKSVQGLLG